MRSFGDLESFGFDENFDQCGDNEFYDGTECRCVCDDEECPPGFIRPAATQETVSLTADEFDDLPDSEEQEQNCTACRWDSLRVVMINGN